VYVLKPNTSGHAYVWKQFSIVHQNVDTSNEECALNYSTCNKCFKVYQLKDSSGRPLGTKNLIEHVKRCIGAVSGKQLQIEQCMSQKPTIDLSASDLTLIKQRHMAYCLQGYNSFPSVEHKGLLNLRQTCVDFGARYGKIDVKSTAFKRKAIANEVTSMATKLKGAIHDHLQQVKSYMKFLMNIPYQLKTLQLLLIAVLILWQL
jgi:hypothetical protein